MPPGRCVVFDFDRTLAASDVSAQLAAASRHASTRLALFNAGFGGQQRVAMLTKLLTTLEEGITALRTQSAPSGKALAAKFDRTGKFEMGYGTLDTSLAASSSCWARR